MPRKEIVKYLEDFGLPGRNIYELPTSQKRFPDGASWRSEELPSKVSEYEEMFEVAKEHGYVINKITDTRGTMYDTDKELLRKLELCREYGTEVMMGPGGGEQEWDISHQLALGQIVHGKIRGMDNIVTTISEMMRATEMGCRGFLMYDEGLLYIACKMRKEGILPPDMKFKISANVSVANAAAIKFWFSLLNPQDSCNPVRDLDLPMIAAMRQVVDNPLDIHVFWRTMARTMSIPEIVRVGAPVYFKNARFAPGVTNKERVMQGIRCAEVMKEFYPEAKQSKPRAKGLAVPAEPSKH